MRKASKILVGLAILSFLIIFALKMQNNMEAMDYYQGEIEEAENRLKVLENANGQEEEQNQEEFFIITDDKIDVVIEATELLESIVNFEQWCDENFNTHAPQCYYVFNDFLNNNKQLTSQMENVINE